MDYITLTTSVDNQRQKGVEFEAPESRNDSSSVPLFKLAVFRKKSYR